MPTIEAGDVAPHDLKEIASFLRNLNGANIDVSKHPEVVDDLMEIAELDFDLESYQQALAENKARADEMYEMERQGGNKEEEEEEGPLQKSDKDVLEEELLKASLEYLKHDKRS